MRKSKKWAALYTRLSSADLEREGESNSIANQKALLKKRAKELGYTNVKFYVDDGFTGTNFNRPSFQEMESDIEQGLVEAVFVKDMSRLGREYLQVGMYIETYFPEHDVRLVAVNDGYDSADGDDDFLPFRNIMNEYYAKDISRKRKSTNVKKAEDGKPLGPPPYGYLKDPDRPGFWMVDPNGAADVVLRIHKLNYEQGLGIGQIAVLLRQEKVLRPPFYYQSIGIKKAGMKLEGDPYEWAHTTIAKILNMREYCGDVINYKSYSKSFKSKKRYKTPEDEQMVILDVHEPVVPRPLKEAILAQRKRKARTKTSDQEHKNLFRGLLLCADCNSPLHFHFNQRTPDIEYYNCSGNNRCHPICSETHYVRADFLEQVVLADIQRITKFQKLDAKGFTRYLLHSTMQDAEHEQQVLRKELERLQARDEELDRLYERVYEDNVNGKINDERFAKMSSKYEVEQQELAVRIKQLENQLSANVEQIGAVEDFVKLANRHAKIKALSPEVLRQFVHHIEVYQAKQVNGKKQQRIKIFYNCVGSLELPEVAAIPFPQVEVKTRKGVAISYSQSLAVNT